MTDDLRKAFIAGWHAAMNYAPQDMPSDDDVGRLFDSWHVYAFLPMQRDASADNPGPPPIHDRLRNNEPSFDECVASGQSCWYEFVPSLNSHQCRYCGKPRPVALGGTPDLDEPIGKFIYRMEADARRIAGAPPPIRYFGTPEAGGFAIPVKGRKRDMSDEERIAAYARGDIGLTAFWEPPASDSTDSPDAGDSDGGGDGGD